jgi:hypothetical protein
MLLTALALAQDDVAPVVEAPSGEAGGDLTPAGAGGSGWGSGGSGCAGGNCACTPHRRCFTKECVRNSVRYEYKTSYEKKNRTTYEEVMEKAERLVDKTSTVTRPFLKTITKTKTEWRTQSGTRDAEVRQHVQSDPVEVPFNPVPTCKASQNCCRAGCSCEGKADCGCCIPNCGGGCTEVPSQWNVMVSKVPETYDIQVPVQVPYEEKVTVNETRTITEKVPEVYWRPRYVKKDRMVTVPVYHKIKIITPTPYKCQQCVDECV